MKRSKRFEKLTERPINQEMFITAWDEAGLIVMGSPRDPLPSLRIEGGVVVEMDGVPRDEFDLIDHFIARHALDLGVAERAIFIIDKKGVIRYIDVHDINVRPPLESIVRALDALQ